ncbi:MAG: right-handed parallel beta-helix repeat-containing protein, partial [bacterium]
AKVRLTSADTYTYWFDVIDGLGISYSTDRYEFKVSPAQLHHLNITPNNAILVINSEVEFEVMGYDTFGNQIAVDGGEWMLDKDIGTLTHTFGSKTTFIAGDKKGTGSIGYLLAPDYSAFARIEVVEKGPVYIKGGEVSGRWTKGGSPYVIVDSVYVPSGKTLIIEPGVVVKFHYYIAQWNDEFLDWLIPPEIIRRNLTVYGNLIAEGTAQEPIIFTPISDEGTSTPEGGGTSTPCFGDWDKLIFEQGSTGRLKYCQIKYAGYADWWYNDIIKIEPAVLIKSRDVQLFNCKVTNEDGMARKSSQQYGIGILIDGVIGNDDEIVFQTEVVRCWGSIVVKNSRGVEVNNNIIRDDGNFGIQICNSSLIKFLTNTVTTCRDAAFSQDISSSEIEYHGNKAYNEFNLIWLSGEMPEDKEIVLKKAELSYGFNSLSVPVGSTLRIEPGAKFVLGRFGHIEEEMRDIGRMQIEGRLIAEGTPEEEIVFDKGKFGNWNYIQFNGPSASGSSLRYCKIIGGGRRPSSMTVGEGSTVVGNLWLINATPKIEYCQIMDSKWYDQGGDVTVGGWWDCGIRLQNLPPGYVLANNTISNCTKGVATYNCPYPPLIASNTLTNNTYVFYQDPNTLAEYHGNVFEDNENSVILTGRAPRVYNPGPFEQWVFTGCEITVPEIVWKLAELPYAIDNFIRVTKDSRLMIEPGVIVKLNGATIEVQGSMTARGTDGAKIVFTGLKDDNIPPGVGGRINFLEDSESELKYCVIEYGDGPQTTGFEAAVRIIKARKVEIGNSVISHCKYDGIRMENTSVIISTTTVSYNGWNGIICENSSAVIQNGTISHNGSSPKDHFGIICRKNSKAIISNNVLSDNFGCPLGQDINTFPEYRDNKIFGNKYDAVGIIGKGNEMKISGTWTNFIGTQTTYFLFMSDMNIILQSGVTLEIEPGVEIKMYPIVESGWNMGAIYVRGKLIASGTKDRPIVFTSFYDGNNEKIWHWNGIVFENGVGTMTYCTVKFGRIGIIGNVSPSIRNCYISKGDSCGMYLKEQANPVIENSIITDNPVGLKLDNASATISTCTISYNSEHGIVCNNSSPVIQNGTISYNGTSSQEYHGIKCEKYSNPYILGNNISYNGGCPVLQDLNSFPRYRDNKIFGNKYDAVGIIGKGNEMKISGTWTNFIGTQTTYFLFMS